ncbi:MAG: hypothetical protein IKS98_02660 [Lachnospiraceae bacterium]|nr:hypothetical protein [Lachnospiraceae bacterium]
MRIFINELIRLWKTPGVIFSVVIACVVTIGVLNVQAKKKLQMFQPADYKEAFDNLEGMPVDEAYALYADIEDDRMDFNAQAFLNRAVKSELEEQATYEEYLNGITKTADMITSVSIFSDKDSYSYKNAKKTSDVYERLKEKIDIETGPSKGVELWSENGITGIIGILVLLVVINEMILKDRESGQLNLLFTMDKGRTEHGAVKLFVCAASAFVVTFIILLTAFLTCGQLFGIGDVSRSIQSVVGLKGCNLKISVAGYIVVYYIVLSFTVTVLSLIVFFIESLIRSSVMVYLAVALVFGIEATLYYVIGDTSYLAILRELNLFSFLNPGRYLSVYGNVSIFGYPVDRFLFVGVSLITIFVLFAPLAVKAYSVQTTIPVKNRKPDGLVTGRVCSLIERVKKRFIPKSVSIWPHEIYKLMICGGTLWILVLFAVFEIYSFTPASEYFENEDYYYLKGYLQKYEGPVTDETILAVEEELEGFDRTYEEFRSVLEKCPPELAAGVSLQYQDRLKPKGGLDLLKARVERLKRNGGYIVYDTGYRLLTFDRMAKHKELTMAITLSIMLVLSLSYLFACDDSLYMDRITSVMLKGRKRLNIKKMIIGSIIAFLIYVMNYFPYVFSIFKVYGSNGLSFPVQSVSHLEGSVFEKLGFSIGGCVGFFLILKYLIMIAEMIVLHFLSKKLRSLSRTLVVGIVIFVGPLLMVYVII